MLIKQAHAKKPPRITAGRKNDNIMKDSTLKVSEKTNVKQAYVKTLRASLRGGVT